MCFLASTGVGPLARHIVSEIHHQGKGCVHVAQLGRAQTAHGLAEPGRADGGRLFDEDACRLSLEVDRRPKRPRRRHTGRGRYEDSGQREQLVGLHHDGVADSALLRATCAARNTKAEDLSSNHELPGVVPDCGDRVHLGMNATRLGDVVAVGGGCLRLEPQRASAPPPLGRLTQREPDRRRVAVPLVPQNREIPLRVLVESSLHRPWHRPIVPQIVLQRHVPPHAGVV